MASETRDVYMRRPRRCLRWSFGFSIPSGSDVSTAPKRTTKTAPEAYGVGKEPSCLDEPFGHPHAEVAVPRWDAHVVHDGSLRAEVCDEVRQRAPLRLAGSDYDNPLGHVIAPRTPWFS